MKKVTIVSYTPYLKDVDDRILKKYLENENVDVEIVSWDDKSYDYTKRDLIIIRSTWDYHERLEEYIAWLNHLKKLKGHVLNDVDIVLDNIHKDKQIKWLKDNNIDILPTEIFSLYDSSMLKPEDTLVKTIKKYFPSYFGKSLFVLKPTVSARSNNTFLIDPFHINDDERAHISENFEEVFNGLLNKFNDRGIILQVYAAGAKNGEYGLVFLDGKLVESIRKKPGILHGVKEKEATNEIPESLIEYAKNIVSKLPQDKVLIARVDAIMEGDRPVLMELELAEPNIYIRATDGIGLNVFDPDWYLPEVERVGCHSKKLVQFAKDIVKRI